MCLARFFKKSKASELGASLISIETKADSIDVQIQELKDVIQILGTNPPHTVSLRSIGAVMTGFIPVGCITHWVFSTVRYNRATEVFKNAISTLSNVTCWATYPFTNHAFSRDFNNMNSGKCEDEGILTDINPVDFCYGLARDVCFGSGMEGGYSAGMAYGVVLGIAGTVGMCMLACKSEPSEVTATVSCKARLSSSDQEKVDSCARNFGFATNFSREEMLSKFESKLNELQSVNHIEYDMGGMTPLRAGHCR